MRATDMSVAVIGAVDYAKALDGLSLKQAQLMLTTQGIVGEEQKDLLVKQGLIATSDRMSASLVSEALANNGLNKEKVEEILIDANLMSQNTKELITENAVTEAKLRAVLAEKGIKGAKADTLIASILQTGQNAKEAISWDVLATSIKKSMIALAQNPLTWIAVAVGAVVGFIKVVDHFAVTAEKLNEQFQELKATEEELISTKDKITEIDGKIAEIQSKGTLSITDNADISRLEQEKLLLKDEIELLEKRKELQQDEYNKNAKRYADGQYSNYTRGQGDITHLMNSYKGYRAKSERTDIDDYFIEDAKRGLKETEAELIEYRNTINENLANLAPDDEESRKKLETIREAIEKLIYTEEELAKIKFDRFIIDPNNTGISEGFEKIKSDGEITTQEITGLANKFPTLKKFMDDNGISAETLAAELNNVGTEAESSGGNVDKMTVSLSELGNVSDKIKTVSDAFKEFSDNGHLSIETIGELKIATGLSDEEFKKYKDTLLSAKVGSSEFNQIMSEMTFKILDNTFTTEGLVNATEDEIAAVLRENGVTNASTVAHYAKQVAIQKDKIATAELEGATEDEIKAILEECETLGLDIGYFYAAIEEKIRYNATHIENSDDIESLLNECKAVGALTGYYQNLGLAKSYSEAYQKNVANGKFGGRILPNGQVVSYNEAKTYADANGMQVTELPYFDPTSLSNINLDDVNVDIPKIDVPTVNYDPDSSKSGSDNTPSYEDPTDAIINRINLRSKELEQQEEQIENAIEIAELENDYKKQISLTNDLIATRKKRVEELNNANAGLHNEAEWLRNSNLFYDKDGNLVDTNTWFNSFGEETEAYKSFYNSQSSKEKQERIKSFFENVSKYKKAYLSNSDEINSINQNILKDEKKLVEIQKEWKDTVLDGISRYYEDQIEQLEKKNELIKEGLELQKSQLESLLTLQQKYFDNANFVEDTKSDIKKGLDASMTMYKYLDEDTRALLFNEDDYIALSDALDKLDAENEKLKTDYKSDIWSATAETIAEVTQQYEHQFELRQKEYEILKASLDVEKKRTELNNVLNERNTKMFINGAWTLVASVEDVKNAQEALADAELAEAQAKRDKEQTLANQELEAHISRLETQENFLDKELKEAQDKWDEIQKSLEEPVTDITDILKDVAENGAPQLKSIIDNLSAGLNNLNKSLGNAKNVSSSLSNSSSSHDAIGAVPDDNGKVLTYDKSQDKWVEVDTKKPTAFKLTTQGVATILEKGKVYDNGGVASGKGLLAKAVDDEEIVLPPHLSKLIISPDYSEKFKTLVKGLESFNHLPNFNLSTLPTFAQRTDSITYDNRIYIDGISLTPQESEALSSVLSRIIPNH